MQAYIKTMIYHFRLKFNLNFTLTKIPVTHNWVTMVFNLSTLVFYLNHVNNDRPNLTFLNFTM